jgi:hypothetical protein
MLAGDQKSEGDLHNVAKKSHVWDPCFKVQVSGEKKQDFNSLKFPNFYMHFQLSFAF